MKHNPTQSLDLKKSLVTLNTHFNREIERVQGESSLSPEEKSTLTRMLELHKQQTIEGAMALSAQEPQPD